MPRSNAVERGEDRRRRTLGTLTGLVWVLAASAGVGAQQPRTKQTADDPRWLAYVGCWSRTADPATTSQLTCVTPGPGSAADIITITNGTIDARERLDVDGQPHPIDKDGCTGSQTANTARSPAG